MQNVQSMGGGGGGGGGGGIVAWISDQIHNKVWDVITHPFPKLKRCNR